MRAIIKSRGVLAALAVLAAVGMAACSANGTPSSAGPGDAQTTIASATAAANATASVAAATPEAPSASLTPAAGGVQDLVITTAEKSALTAAYVAFRRISLSDVAEGGPMPGSVYYAYIPATGGYWALAQFEPSRTAPLNAAVGFQDGGSIGVFRKARAGTWHVAAAGIPAVCGEIRWFPPTVLRAWALPTSPPAGMSC